MPNKQTLEWRNENSYRSYPLVENDVVPNDFILDACIFLPTPFSLIKVVNQQYNILIQTTNNVVWLWPKNSPISYTYNDY